MAADRSPCRRRLSTVRLRAVAYWEYRPATNLHIRRCRPTASPVTIRSMSFLGILTSGKERFSAAKIMHSCRNTRQPCQASAQSSPQRALEPVFLAALDRRRERGVSLRSRRQWWLRLHAPRQSEVRDRWFGATRLNVRFREMTSVPVARFLSRRFWSRVWQSHRRHRLMTYALIATKWRRLWR